MPALHDRRNHRLVPGCACDLCPATSSCTEKCLIRGSLMSSRWVRTSVIALGAVAVGVYVATRQSEPGADTTGPGERPQDPFRNNEEGKALRHFLSVMYSHGENAAEIYAQALKPLRAKAEGVAVEIAHVESSLKEIDYPS